MSHEHEKIVPAEVGATDPRDGGLGRKLSEAEESIEVGKLSKAEGDNERKPVFEVFPDVEGKWRWRLVAANHEITAQSEAYEGGKSAACIGAAATKRIAAEADIVVVEA